MYTKFMNYLADTQNTKRENEYSVDGVYADSFPEYYSGTYINKKGKLVFVIYEPFFVDDFYNSEYYKELISITGSDDFLCRSGKRQYREYVKQMTSLVFEDEIKKLSDIGIDVVSAGINCYNQSIDLFITNDYLPDDIILNDIYNVILNQSPVVSTIGTYAGEGITNWFKNLSVACRVKKISGNEIKYGLLSCGHDLADYVGTTIYLPPYETGLPSNVSIGVLETNNLINSGDTDASFITTFNTVDLYNSVFLAPVNLYSGCFILQSEGSTVYKRGMRTGVTSGIVQNASFMFNGGGVIHFDFVKNSAYAMEGDSGGIAYSAPNSSNYAYIVGIVSTRALDYSYSTYSKIGPCISNLGVVLY